MRCRVANYDTRQCFFYSGCGEGKAHRAGEKPQVSAAKALPRPELQRNTGKGKKPRGACGEKPQVWAAKAPPRPELQRKPAKPECCGDLSYKGSYKANQIQRRLVNSSVWVTNSG
jgi:hypothetical protein